jgi:hypothetical protein
MATTILGLQQLKDSNLSSKQLQELVYEKRAQEEQKNKTMGKLSFKKKKTMGKLSSKKMKKMQRKTQPALPALPMGPDQSNLQFLDIPMGIFNKETAEGLEELDRNM